MQAKRPYRIRTSCVAASTVLLGVLLAAGCTDLGSPWGDQERPAPPAKIAATQPAQQKSAEADAATGKPVSPAAQEDNAAAVREYLAQLEAASRREASPVPAVPPTVAIEPGSATSDARSPANRAVDVDEPAMTQTEPAIDRTPAVPRLLRVAIVEDEPSPPAAEDPPTVKVNKAMDVEPPDAQASLAHLIERATAQLRDNPSDAGLQWRLSLLALAAGKPQDAADISPDVPEQRRVLLSRTVAAIDEVDRLLADPVTGGDNALAALDDLRAAVREAAELQIPRVALCTKVTTFGIYDEFPEEALQPHTPNRVIVYCEVANFQSQQEGENRYRTALSSRLELFTSDGRSLWSRDEDRIEDVSMCRRNDFFLAQLVSLPGVAPGDYVLKVTITDVLASKSNQAVHDFSVSGPAATVTSAF